MVQKVLIIIFLSASLFVFPTKTFAADVVINEIFANPADEANEFIELYNNTDGEIDLANWKISDKVKTYTITNLKIGGKSFLVLKKSITDLQLNNSDEEIKLKNASDSDVDSFSFSTTIADKSWSRYPDGSGSFVNDTNSTEGSANSAPPPTSTPAVTSTPVPTNTPTPTKAPTAAPTATPRPTSIVLPTKKISPTVSKDDSDLSLASDSNSESPFDNDETPTPTESEGEVMGASTSSSPQMFIVLGLIFLAVCGILAYFQFGDKIMARLRKTR